MIRRKLLAIMLAVSPGWMQASSVNFGKVIRENNLKIE
jgi:hypothetical protein